jgi:hypothetical protein
MHMNPNGHEATSKQGSHRVLNTGHMVCNEHYIYTIYTMVNVLICILYYVYGIYEYIYMYYIYIYTHVCVCICIYIYVYMVCILYI